MDHPLAGRYRLLDRLGTGGMSVVWRAHDDVLDRAVAIKVLATELARDPGLPARVRVEARTAARLRHPNVVEVHDYGETEDHLPYVVMELVDGRSLAEVLDRGAVPWRSAVLIGTQVAAALAAAHACGVVHRDVKPSNVMVTSAGVKLVDFGISATVGEADGIGGEVFGTPAYLAPERLGGGPVRPATDVYALGLLLYLMLAGRLPWEASTTTQMLRAHRYLEPAGLPPTPGLPDEVADLCARCLAKDPADRPDADKVARLLAGAAGLAPATPLLDGLADDAPPATGPATQVARPRRRRALVAGAAAAAVAATGSLLWFSAQPDDQVVQAAAAAPVAARADGPACTVGYAIRRAAGGRLSTAVTIANTGAHAADEWHLTFVLPDGQKLVRGWDRGWTQDGQALRVQGSGLAAGERLDTGFDASYRDATTLPGQFRLNDTVCTAQMSVVGATAPATRAATAARATAPVSPAVASRSRVARDGTSGNDGQAGERNAPQGRDQRDGREGRDERDDRDDERRDDERRDDERRDDDKGDGGDKGKGKKGKDK